MKRLLATVLAVCMVCTAALAAVPATTFNRDRQSYGTWATTVKSYLYVRSDGGLSRVIWTGEEAVVEDYDRDFVLQNSRTIQPELPIWGGFFAGEEYNFLIFGQNNEEEDDNKEVIRVVKYDKEWNRLGSAGLFGANTIHPFDAGSLRCDEYGGYLYVRTCHEMYTSSDGLNHQANVTFSVRQEDMTVTDSFTGVMNVSYGYVSHSFNQFILVDGEGTIVAADHGDAYPRSIVLMTYPTKAGGEKFVPGGFRDQTTALDLVEFPGSIGQNATGGSLGGLAETRTGYVVAYNWNGQDGDGPRDVYLAYVGKDMTEVKTRSVTVPESATTPHLVSTGLEGGYLLWTSGGQLFYATYNAAGELSEATAAAGQLSDCKPIPYGDGIVWFVSANSIPAFYTLDDTGISVHYARTYPMGQRGTVTVEEMPMTGTAYRSNLEMTLDGEYRQFRTYALKDAAGNLTNYVELRRAAEWLMYSSDIFDVEWDGKQILISSQHPYDHKVETYGDWNGGEEVPYTVVTAPILVDGEMVWVNAFCLTDENGGGHTYYKLRDLGALLNFYVGWDGAKGQVVIDTTRDHE